MVRSGSAGRVIFCGTTINAFCADGRRQLSRQLVKEYRQKKTITFFFETQIAKAAGVGEYGLQLEAYVIRSAPICETQYCNGRCRRMRLDLESRKFGPGEASSVFFKRRLTARE